MTRRSGRTAAIFLALSLVAAACGADTTTTTAASGTTGAATTTAAGTALTGQIAISGSSTVEPITARVAENFVVGNSGVAISVEGPGTGDGFGLFCAGETDISDASRPIKDSEADTCATNGIDWIELYVAIDGLSVLTSHDNTAVSCLDTADLYALVGSESIGFDSWADANALAAELGAPHAPYPDVPLEITAPGEESGTFDTFVEFLIGGVAGGDNYSDTRGADSVRPDYVASANDNVIIEGIAANPSSLGWVGYAFYVANQDRVKALAISAGDGKCVDPTPETIADGSYPFSRPLFIYVNAEAASRPEVAAFVDFYLSAAGLVSVTDAGYVSVADYAPTIGNWTSRTTGRVFS